MIVKEIRLKNFRNVKEAKVSFAPGVNVLYGDNAEGKTNLLEAVYFAAIGKSFRGQHLSEVVSFDENEASLSLDFIGGGREQNIYFRLFGNRMRTVEKNKVHMTRMSELMGAFRAVLFCPEHLSLIKEGPSERRQYLDIAISSAEPLYLASLQRYNRVLKQRNALLKTAEEEPQNFAATIDVWSAQLAKEAAYIARSRHRYLTRAAVHVQSCFADMTEDREKPTLSYMGPAGRDADYEDLAAVEAYCLEKLTTRHEREIAAGATLYGVHKDDIEVLLNGKEARLYGSQGQQRSLALAFKLAEGEVCREDCGEYPVFLLDDVLSELDGGRRRYLIEKIGDKQVILTTCEEDGFTSPRRILVKGGTYTPQDG